MVPCTQCGATWRMEKSVRDSEERFRQIVENVPEVFWVSTMDFQEVLYVNPAYEEAWGRTCESLYKRPLEWMEGIHPEDRKWTKAQLAEALRKQERFSVEYRLKCFGSTSANRRCEDRSQER